MLKYRRIRWINRNKLFESTAYAPKRIASVKYICRHPILIDHNFEAHYWIVAHDEGIRRTNSMSVLNVLLASRTWYYSLVLV